MLARRRFSHSTPGVGVDASPARGSAFAHFSASPIVAASPPPPPPPPRSKSTAARHKQCRSRAPLSALPMLATPSPTAKSLRRAAADDTNDDASEEAEAEDGDAGDAAVPTSTTPSNDRRDSVDSPPSSAGSSSEEADGHEFASSSSARCTGARARLDSPMFMDSPAMSVQAHTDFDWQPAMSPFHLAYDGPPSSAGASIPIPSPLNAPMQWLDEPPPHTAWSPYGSAPPAYSPPAPLSASSDRVTRAILSTASTHQPLVDLAAYFDRTESDDRRKRRRMVMLASSEMDMEHYRRPSAFQTPAYTSLHTTGTDTREAASRISSSGLTSAAAGFSSVAYPPTRMLQYGSPHVLSVSAAASTPITSVTVSGNVSASSSPSPAAPIPTGNGSSGVSSATLSVPSNYLRTDSERLDTAAVSSVIKHLYGLADEEMGHRTFGHSCVSREEIEQAANGAHDLLYGEVLPVGATRLFDRVHLDLRSARTLCDLGSGLGKLAIQAFLQWPNLTRVSGCELSQSRFEKSGDAIMKMLETRQQWRKARKAQQAAERGQELDGEEQKASTQPTPPPLLPRLSLQTTSTLDDKPIAIRFTETVSAPRSSRMLRELATSMHGSGSVSGHSGSSAPSHAGLLVDPDWMSVREYEQFLTQQRQQQQLQQDLADTEMASPSDPPPAPSSPKSRSSSVDPPHRSHLLSTSAFGVDTTRTLELRCLNLFDMTDAFTADVVICETKFQEENYPALCQLVYRLKKGCRLLTYENLDVVFTKVYGEIPTAAAQPTAEGAHLGQRRRRREVDDEDDDEEESVRAMVMEEDEEEADSEPRLAGQVEQLIAKHGGSASSRMRSKSSTTPAAAAAAAVSGLLAIAAPARMRESKRKRDSPARKSITGGGGGGAEGVPGEFNPSSMAAAESTPSPRTAALGRTSLRATHHVAAASSTGTPVGSSSSPPSARSSSPTPCARHPYNPFRQLPINLSKSDRFFTSWATNLGHRFFLQEMVGPMARVGPATHVHQA